MMIFDVEVVLTFAFLLSLTFATTSSFLSVGIFVVILGLDLFLGNVIKWIRTGVTHVSSGRLWYQHCTANLMRSPVTNAGCTPRKVVD